MHRNTIHFKAFFLKLIRTVINTQMYPFESPSEGGVKERRARRHVPCVGVLGGQVDGSRGPVVLSLLLLAGAGGRGKGS